MKESIITRRGFFKIGVGAALLLIEVGVAGFNAC